MILAAIISIGLLTFFTICIVVMLVVLAKAGDERRKMIVDQTAATTLKYYVVVSIILTVIHAAQGQNVLTINDTNTFSSLTVVAFIFVVALFHYARKFKA